MTNRKEQRCVHPVHLFMKIQKINTFSFWIPIFLQRGNTKCHRLWFRLITTSNYKDVQYTRIHTGVCGMKFVRGTKKHAMCGQYRSGLMKTRTKINRLWSASTIITVTVTESADTQRGAGMLWWRSTAFDEWGWWGWQPFMNLRWCSSQTKMEYVRESWNLNTILLSNRNPSDCHLTGSEDVTK